jgi:hypothetical protein
MRRADRTMGTDRLIAIGLAATTAVVLAGVVAQLVGYGPLHGRVEALDSSSDGGLFGIVGDISVTAAALAAWITLARVRPVSSAAVALPPLLTFLAVDKATRLHDHIPGWLAFYLPLLAATFVCVLAVARRLSRRCVQLAMTGLALLAGSFLVHQYGEWLLHHSGTFGIAWARQVKAAVKHGSEVAGWFVVAVGLAAGIRDRDERSHGVGTRGRYRRQGVGG